MRRLPTRTDGRAPGRAPGQALVEFSLAIIVFLVLLMGVFDFGRGIFMYNGLAEASREIARRTSVYVGDPIGESPETVATIATQRALVPGMEDPTFSCHSITGGSPADAACGSGDFVKVTVTATYSPVSMLGFLGDIDLSASSTAQVP